MTTPLPVLKPGSIRVNTLLRTVHRHDLLKAQAAGQRSELEWQDHAGQWHGQAVLIVNPRHKDLAWVNQAMEIKLSATDATLNHDPSRRIEAARTLVQRIEDEYRTLHAVCLQWSVTAEERQAELEQVFVERGGRRMRRAVMQLMKYIEPNRRNEQLQIVPARAVYELYRRYVVEQAEQQGHPSAFCAQEADAQVEALDETRYEVWVARLQERIVGHAGLLTQGDVGVLDEIYADPSCRGQGVGSTLLAYVMESAARARLAAIAVSLPTGCPATPMYVHAGFVQVGELTRYVH